MRYSRALPLNRTLRMKEQFFETIRIEGGKAFNLLYHNRRFWRTQREIFGLNARVDLASVISPPSNGLYRCKIIYDETIRSVTYYPYTPKIPSTFKLINASITYSYKYLDRSAIDELFAQRGKADEIIIVKDGLLTDTSIANIAFYYRGEWLTPKKALLAGTTRERLLEQKRLKVAEIAAKDTKKFATMAIMNAMIDFTILKNFSIKD